MTRSSIARIFGSTAFHILLFVLMMVGFGVQAGSAVARSTIGMVIGWVIMAGVCAVWIVEGIKDEGSTSYFRGITYWCCGVASFLAIFFLLICATERSRFGAIVLLVELKGMMLIVVGLLLTRKKPVEDAC